MSRSGASLMRRQVCIMYFVLVGQHGYNNSLPEMHPYFIAYGPAFKRGYNVTQFMNLDIFPLMCHILGVKCPPNNGSFERVKPLLNPEWLKPRIRTYSNAFRRQEPSFKYVPVDRGNITKIENELPGARARYGKKLYAPCIPEIPNPMGPRGPFFEF